PFLGPEDTDTHGAARARFRSAATLLATASIGEVLREAEQGQGQSGVGAIENSTEGVLGLTLDLLVESDLRLCAEVVLWGHHNLWSRTGRAEDIERIVSHPQELGQCRRWLAGHFPKVDVEEVGSTAHAAMMAAEDAKLAAISSSLAKEVYELQMV